MVPEPLILEGAYRLLRPAGTGATADVYLAEATDGSGARVAVKVLKKELADKAEMRSRFQREAALLEHVRHPNVVRLLRYEVAPEGTLLLLEWVEGRRLDEELERQTLLGLEKRLVLEQVASALATVHALGIVHRDLKPENVMLDRRGEQVRACLVDFGIARPLEHRSAEHFVTNPGMVAGTPAYLAPEQWSDRVPDPRTDIYGFGVMAYLMISGNLPFVASDDLALMRLHLEAAPRRPRALELELEPVIPVVMRCLEKNPAKRPTDGGELAGLLGAALVPRARRWFQRG